MTKTEWDKRLKGLGGNIPSSLYKHPQWMGDDDQEQMMQVLEVKYPRDVSHPSMADIPLQPQLTPETDPRFERWPSGQVPPMVDPNQLPAEAMGRNRPPEYFAYLVKLKQDERMREQMAEGQLPHPQWHYPPYEGPRSIMSTGATAPTAALDLDPVQDITPFLPRKEQGDASLAESLSAYMGPTSISRTSDVPTEAEKLPTGIGLTPPREFPVDTTTNFGMSFEQPLPYGVQVDEGMEGYTPEFLPAITGGQRTLLPTTFPSVDVSATKPVVADAVTTPVAAPTADRVRTIDDMVPDNTMQIINEIEDSRSKRRRRINGARALLGLPPIDLPFTGSGLSHAQLLAQIQNKRDVAIGMSLLKAGPMDEDAFRQFLVNRGIFDPDEVKKANEMRKSLQKDWGREKTRIEVQNLKDARRRDEALGAAIMTLPKDTSEQSMMDALFSYGLTRASDLEKAGELFTKYWPEVKFQTFYKKDKKTGDIQEVRVPNNWQKMMLNFIGDTSWSTSKPDHKYGESRRIALPVLEGMSAEKKEAVLAAAKRLGVTNPERIGATGTVSLDSEEDLRDLGIIFDNGGAAMGAADNWAQIRDLNGNLIGQVNLAHGPAAEYYNRRLAEEGTRGTMLAGEEAAAAIGATTQYSSKSGIASAISEFHQARGVGSLADQVLNIMKPESDGGLGRPDWVGTPGWLQRLAYETGAIGESVLRLMPGMDKQKDIINSLRADLENQAPELRAMGTYDEVKAEIDKLDSEWFEQKKKNIPEGLLTADILQMGIGVLLARMLNPKDRLLKDYFAEARKMAQVQGPFLSPDLVWARMSWISRESKRYMSEAQEKIAQRPPATYRVGPQGRVLPVENLQEIKEATTISEGDPVEPTTAEPTAAAPTTAEGTYTIRIYTDGRRVRVYADGSEVEF